MQPTSELVARISHAVNRDRLVATAEQLCAIYSPTGQAGEVSDCLAAILARDGFAVERHEAGWPAAPAVAARHSGSRTGRVLQFDGHLDTVHLPFVPPAVVNGRLTGSGSSDMKAGVAAAVEALRVIRELDLIEAGGVLLTAHDLHEAPWGDGSQLENMIREGVVGDAVLIPEYLCDRVAVRGRGQAVIRLTVTRSGPPVHEVMRPLDEPNVVAVGAELVRRLMALDAQLATAGSDPYAGRASVFVGQIHCGEIYNQYASELWMEGTRRWLPGTSRAAVEAEYRELAAELARESGARIDARFQLVRDAFELDLADPIVAAFQGAMETSSGKPLPIGGKPFVDDGSSFWHVAQRAVITHGPRGAGAHTLEEWVDIDELVRVAGVYALTAAAYCNGSA